MTHTTKIRRVDDGSIVLDSSCVIARQIANIGAAEVVLKVVDPRDISVDQRRKARVLVGEVASWSGHPPDDIHNCMKHDFITQKDLEAFSLADCDKTTARLYITYLIDFCIKHGVPTKKPLYAFCDDIEAYVYQCLASRKCAVHNRAGADIHHCEGSRVGMGRDRKTIIHVGLKCIPLCRECHDECHHSEVEFFKKHHLDGLPLDQWLCNRLGLNAEVS